MAGPLMLLELLTVPAGLAVLTAVGFYREDKQ